MQRRAFIKAGAASLLAPYLVSGCQQSATADAGANTMKLDKFGLQLSTVTPLMLADFEGTLAQVAEIGYQQVEFSAMGFLGRSPAQIEALLKKHDLEAPVGRITPELPEGFFTLERGAARQVFRERSQPRYLLQNVAHSLEAAVALKQRYLVLPALMPDNFQTLDQVKANIEAINEAGAMCAKQNVIFGYHNHNWELAPLNGLTPYDLMLEETDPNEVTFQLDAYWIVKGGGSLSDYLARFPGRFSSCHLKDIDQQGDFADVGDGLIDFPDFTRQAIAQGTQYFFVERDNPPEPARSIQRSYAYLEKMIF